MNHSGDEKIYQLALLKTEHRPLTGSRCRESKKIRLIKYTLRNDKKVQRAYNFSTRVLEARKQCVAKEIKRRQTAKEEGTRCDITEFPWRGELPGVGNHVRSWHFDIQWESHEQNQINPKVFLGNRRRKNIWWPPLVKGGHIRWLCKSFVDFVSPYRVGFIHSCHSCDSRSLVSRIINEMDGFFVRLRRGTTDHGQEAAFGPFLKQYPNARKL